MELREIGREPVSSDAAHDIEDRDETYLATRQYLALLKRQWLFKARRIREVRLGVAACRVRSRQPMLRRGSLSVGPCVVFSRRGGVGRRRWPSS